jgi:hypothetical protein
VADIPRKPPSATAAPTSSATAARSVPIAPTTSPTSTTKKSDPHDLDAVGRK